MLVNLVTLQAHPVAYTTIAVLTGTTFFFGGFAREQICIYACPWPRIQAAMMDEDTLTVGYRWWRGEPRKHSEAVRKGAPQGDCIDCRACVNVCPMGIDIRDGQQMECITCALCIDACDAIMEKIGKPRGLIDYMALTDEAREVSGLPPKPIWQHVFRPRTLLYTALWSAVGIGLLVALFIRPDIELTVAPVRNPTHVVLADGSVRNTYELRLRNKHPEERPFRITVRGDVTIRSELEGSPYETVKVPANAQKLQRLYLIAPPGSEPARAERTAVRIWVEDLLNGERAYKDTIFFGKGE